MNAEHIHYMHAMGIQPWLLKNKQCDRTRIVLVSEPFNEQGSLLWDAMLESIALNRNLVHFMPSPLSDSFAQQIALLNPTLILVTDETAAHFLLDTKQPHAELRGKIHTYGLCNIPLIITFHPTHLLKNPMDKRKALQDLQLIACLLNDN